MPIFAAEIQQPEPFANGCSIQPEDLPMFTTLVRLIREWKRYSRSVRELSSLGDRELADIGISRSDIQRVAWNAAQQR